MVTVALTDAPAWMGPALAGALRRHAGVDRVLDGESTTATAHHAWAEVWVEGLGWVGFDVANRVCPTDRYVRLAAGLDAGYAAPIIGSRREQICAALQALADC